jgi:titin
MIKLLIKYAFILITVLLFNGCVQSVENPYNGGNNYGNKPVINIVKPISGDSINMGITQISYQATDYDGGPGLKLFNLLVNGTYIQSFFQNEDGTNPDIFFNTDTLEKKLGINPANWPDEISYMVTVVNKNDEVGKTPLIDSIYVSRVPVAPWNLTLTRITDKSFNLFWDDNASNEVKYEVWRQDGKNNAFFHLKDLPNNTISTNDVVNTDYINYGYKVRAVNGFGASAFSNIVYSSGANGGDAPSNLVGEALGASSIHLTWQDNSETEDGFIIERTNPATGKFERLAVLPRNTTEYFDSGLSPLTTYSYKVASYKTSSISAYSNIVIISTYNRDVAPPANLKAEYNPAQRAVIVTWDDNTVYETGTIIERKETINGKYQTIGNTATDVNTFTDNDIVENKLYYYRARFTTVENFKTTYSNEDTVYIYVAPPTAPSNLNIIKFSDTTYSLWWEDNSNDEEGFELWRKAGNTGTYVLYKKLLPNTTAFNDTVLSTVVYYYKVRAFRNPVYSTFTNEVNTVEGSLTEFPAPSNLSAIVKGTQIQLNWKNNGKEELQIIVERKFVTETKYREIKRLPPQTITWTDTDAAITHNTTLYYRLKAKYSQGESSYSEELTVYVP